MVSKLRPRDKLEKAKPVTERGKVFHAIGCSKSNSPWGEF